MCLWRAAGSPRFEYGASPVGRRPPPTPHPPPPSPPPPAVLRSDVQHRRPAKSSPSAKVSHLWQLLEGEAAPFFGALLYTWIKLMCLEKKKKEKKEICQDLMRCTLQPHANTYVLFPSVRASMRAQADAARCHANCYECLFKHPPLFFHFFLQNRHSTVATTVQHNLLNNPTQLKRIILHGREGKKNQYFYWVRNWKILVRTLDIVFCFGFFFSLHFFPLYKNSKSGLWFYFCKW